MRQQRNYNFFNSTAPAIATDHMTGITQQTIMTDDDAGDGTGAGNRINNSN